jgi:methionyl aminopeptidase
MNIKSAADIAGLTQIGVLHAEVVSALTDMVRPGVTTDELEAAACRLITERDCTPSFKHYRPGGASRPFPCALCVAPNDVVVHGIPTEMHYTLKDGDIIGLDVGLTKNGLTIDAGKTVPCGKVDKAAVQLLRVTQEALMLGIAHARAGNQVGDIGHAIETHVRKAGYGLVRDLCGHGVGHAVHEDPQIPNYGAPHTGVRLVAGMVLAIEPMVNEGKGQVDFLSDGYTVKTRDHTRSAHFEHNVVVTEGAPVVLTKW